MQSTRYICRILMKLEFFRHIFEKASNITFNWFLLHCCKATKHFALLQTVFKYLGRPAACPIFCLVLNESEVYRHIFVEEPSIQVQENASSGNQLIQADRHDEGKRRFSRLTRTCLKHLNDILNEHDRSSELLIKSNREI